MTIDKLGFDEKHVFCLLQKDGPLSKKDILSYFEYKPSTLNRIIAALLEKKAIVEFGQAESSGGRKPSLFDINVSEKYLIGIEISRTFAYVVLCDLKLRIMSSELTYAPVANGYPEGVMDEITKIVRRLLIKRSISIDDILGAGLGMVGPVNRYTGCTGEVTDFLLDTWRNVPIRSMAEQRLGCAVYTDNGTYAGVLAEYLYGEGKNYKSISYFNCGICIRSGQISSGVIIRSASFEEDAFSHTTIDLRGERCSCGKRGCVVCYASTRVIADNIRRRIKAGEPTLIEAAPDEINYLNYRPAAEKGDTVVAEELRSAGTCFGIGLANYITLLNPEYVVISGPLAVETSIFYDTAVKTTLGNIYKSDKTKPVFKKGGSFGIAAISVGAAAMFYERYMTNPIMD